MKATLIKTPENLYKLKFNNDNDMLLCATALLSSKNCDEIFGIVNIEKLAEEYSDKEYGGGQSPSYFSGFSDGFNKAMELYQPTEIEVEIEMEEHCRPMPNIHAKYYLPKLDSEGCLILTKKI